MHTHTHTYTYLCVWHAVRAKRAARLTATFCSLPFYFLPFLTLAQHMQAYTGKGAEGGGKRGRGEVAPCRLVLLYKCFIMGLAFQTFIRFDLVCMLRESLPSFGFRFSFILLLRCFSAFSTCNAKVSCEWGNCFLTSQVITTLYSYFFVEFFSKLSPALKLKIKLSAHESVNCSLTLCWLIKFRVLYKFD